MRRLKPLVLAGFFALILGMPFSGALAAFATGEHAHTVLGQYDDMGGGRFIPDYLADAVNNGEVAVNALGYNQPQGIAIDSTYHRLFVADTGNNRVLVYALRTDGVLEDIMPDAVLGQTDFTSNTAAITQSGLSGPSGMAFDPTKNLLYVLNVNRVSVFDVASITNGEAAVNVLGQANFTATAASALAGRLSAPRGVVYDAGKSLLYVASFNTNRVTVFDVASITNGEDAVAILGQASFATTASSLTVNGLVGPTALAFDQVNDRLFVANLVGHRVSVFDTAALVDGEDAVAILGQADAVSNVAATTREGMNAPQSLAFDAAAQRLYVGQLGNHRVSIFGDAVPGFLVTETGGNTTITEGGSTDTLEIVLTDEPLSDVVLSFSVSSTAATTTPATLTFTSTTWDIPQSVTVSAPLDFDVVDSTTTLAVAIDTVHSDATWNTLASQQVTVFITDDGIDHTPPPPAPTPVAYQGGTAVYGCTDRTASNYNPHATLQNHNSCEYPPGGSLVHTPPPISVASDSATSQPIVCQIKQLPTKPIKPGVANDAAQVKLLEAYLNAELGKTLPIDGVYAAEDIQAVIAWQERYANDILKPWGIRSGTGFISTYSLKKLAEIQEAQCRVVGDKMPETLCFAPSGNLSRDDNGADILALQRILKKIGYLTVAPNGHFGPATHAAVLAYQKKNGITQTGTVGPMTRNSLQKTGVCP